MSDAAQPLSDLPFEQQIFLRSPFGLPLTTLILFALFFGSFLGVAALEQVAILRPDHTLTGAAWPALVLSLLCCAALAMQRYARVAEARDTAAYAKILTGGMASAADVTSVAARDAQYLRPTLIGLVVGLAISVLVRVSETREGHPMPPLTLVWFALATTVMMVLFVRGVAQTAAGDRGYSRLLSAELKIDLLRIDTLAVLGRSAARSALTWFVISAIACLFFVGGDLEWLTALLVLSCVAMGLGLFVGVMNRIHKQIVAAKTAELEQIRHRIDTLRASLHEDAFASASLHGLLAYEKRISDAHEWPFDQTTLVRVAASAFIVTVPWFGQAVAAYVVEHVGHMG